MTRGVLDFGDELTQKFEKVFMCLCRMPLRCSFLLEMHSYP